MEIQIFDDDHKLAAAAAQKAATVMRKAIEAHDEARIIVATGTSQFDFLRELIAMPALDWTKVELFHLDEYIGLAPDHPASFNRYIRERLIQNVPIRQYHLLDGSQDPQQIISAVSAQLGRAAVNIAFTGLGENGHLAFNDPPADFDNEDSYIVVKLAEASRKQQFAEGWFPSLEAVPKTAITMTIRQILKAEEILCLATGERKAKAVASSFEGAISPMAPASILRTHPHATIFLDSAASQNLHSRP